MPGIKSFISHNQETGNPIFMRVVFPKKRISPENATIPMLEISMDILPGIEKVVFDKWFSVGSLLSIIYLHFLKKDHSPPENGEDILQLKGQKSYTFNSM